MLRRKQTVHNVFEWNLILVVELLVKPILFPIDFISIIIERPKI